MRRTNYVLLFVYFSLTFNFQLFGQADRQSETQEVYLTFRYKQAINKVITAHYKNGQFYLPVVTLLNLLQIDYEVDMAKLSVSGFYLNTDKTYSLHFLDSAHYAVVNQDRIALPFESFLVMQLDFYITPAKFEQIFGLKFSVNFNALNLKLKTEETMPVVAALKRKRNRKKVQNLSYGHEGYPLLYHRNRSWANGGYVDYALSANIASGSNTYTYAANMGIELLGGDVQGQVLGSYSNDFSALQFNNLRYRYVTNKSNKYLTQIRAGQISTEGLTQNAILGVGISNEPAVPKILFDNYVINGNTEPGSEIELYLNNTLAGFKIADGLGDYTFKVPLAYGRSRLRVQIYGPGGQIQQNVQRVEIPFTFVPPGKTYYSISAGRLKNAIIGTTDLPAVVQSHVSSGITNWLTVSAGAEYFGSSTDALPTFYGSFSSRILRNYNISSEIAPQAFYTFNVNAIYPSSFNWNLAYKYYTEDRGVYNRLGVNQQLKGRIFIPLSLNGLPLNIQFFANRQFRNFNNLTHFRFNVNTRFKKVNFRMGYMDTKVGDFDFSPSPAAKIKGSATYSLSRRPGIPSVLRGSFIRTSATYNPYLSQLERVELNIAKDFFSHGNIQLNLSHNFVGDFNLIGFNFTFDFNKVRANTTFYRNQSNSILSQTLRGSVGYDSNRNKLLAVNRQQVGRGGASFRLFVDEDGTGKYKPGDELIDANAISLKRSSGSLFKKDGVIYLTQLTAYDRYDVKVNKAVIKNPLLVPSIEKFSFIADPNSYKTIDVPFYISGVISGKVVMRRDSIKQPVSGLTINLDEQNGDYHKELHTFTDGSFYAYEIPPGKYVIHIDASQIDFLQVAAQPKEIFFEVEAKRNGDFVEGLDFVLIPDEKNE